MSSTPCRLKLPKLQTCLSPYVHKLIVESTQSVQRDPCVLDKNGLLDFEYICSKLPAEESEDDPTRYFTTCVTVLAPMFHSIEDFMSDVDSDLWRKYCRVLDWTGQTERLQELWGMMTARDDVDDLTVLLVTTAILERSLGNVYLIEGPEPCPSMLKDLLVSPYLRNILGGNVIKVLRIIIGPPTSLNIRNVAWHGFPFPGEIPRRCILFIILLVPSIGQILLNKHIEQTSCRVPLAIPEAELVSESKVVLRDDWLEMVNNTELVAWNTKHFWKKVKQFYAEQRYSYCAALLLFYLEQGLRRVFATVNNCEDRILTAEATTLYTTFDEILDSRLPDSSENRIIHCVSPELIEILLDHLQYQQGPRVRDRLSHGEACWESFPWQLTDNLATVAMVLSAMCVPSRTDEMNNRVSIVFKDISEYKVQFHRIAVLKKQILENCLKVSKIDGLVTFMPDLSERLWNTEYPVSTSHVELAEILQKSSIALSENCSHNTYLPVSSDSFRYSSCTDFSSAMEKLLQVRINTLYREHQLQSTNAQSTDREGEILTFLEHVLAECHTVVTNIQDFITTRQIQLVDKQLRSRQRDNFKKFLNSFPSYMSVTNMCSCLCSWQLYDLDNMKCQDCFPSKLRFWKRTLQFCENLRTCSQPDKNKWTEGVDLISQFTNTLKYNIVSQLICRHDACRT